MYAVFVDFFPAIVLPYIFVCFLIYIYSPGADGTASVALLPTAGAGKLLQLPLGHSWSVPLQKLQRILWSVSHPLGCPCTFLAGHIYQGDME